MRNARLLAAAAVLCGAALLPVQSAAQDQPRRTLRPFESDSGFVRFNRQLQRELEEQRRRNPPTPPPPVPMAMPAPTGEAQGAARARADESITNVQHAGVDEGGIVKVHGDYLVILRRGRLFWTCMAGLLSGFGSAGCAGTAR